MIVPNKMLEMKDVVLHLLIVHLWISKFAHSYSLTQYYTEETERLEKYADILQRSVNTAVNPCEKFLDYVNGNLSDIPKIPKLTTSEETMQKLYVTLFKQKMQPTREEKIVQDFYISCEKLPKTYVEAIKILDINELIYFPILDSDWPDVNVTLEQIVAKLSLFGIHDFITGDAIKDDNGEYKFLIDHKSSSYIDNVNWKKNTRLVLQQYGFAPDLILAKMEHIKQFESKFQFQELPTSTRRLATIGEMMDKYPLFNWKEYFSIIAGDARVSDNNEVQIVYEEKLNFYYNVYPRNLTQIVAIYYLLRLHERLQIIYKTSKDHCLETVDFGLVKEIFTNKVLQNLVNDHDAVNFVDVASSEMETNKPSYFDAAKDLVARKNDYETYVVQSFQGISIAANNYLSNFLKLSAASKIREISEEFKDCLHFLHLFSFTHLKPRILLPVVLALESTLGQNSYLDKSRASEDISEKQIPITTALKIMSYLQKLDGDKWENEENVLTKFDLTHRKAVLIYLGQHFAGKGNTLEKVSGFQRVLNSMEEFNEEFNCTNTVASVVTL